MTPEQLAIAGLFAVLQGFAGAVIRALWNENKELKDENKALNQASRDLIAIQAQALKDRGVSIVSKPPDGG
jgi:2-hydroxychromene-2-carboxylate isomerase